MAVDRRDANLKKLNEADELQDKTKEAVWRIQRQAAEAEELGVQTLEELRRQGTQMDDINQELESVGAKLDTSAALQNQFNRWAGNWLGGKRRKAMKEASEEIAERSKEEHSKVKEVFQHQKYDSIARKWRKNGLVLCNDPTLSCDDVFDPKAAEQAENSRWAIDFSLAGIDAEGWTYANSYSVLNKTGAGEPSPQWNSYVRRRKWRYVDRQGGGGAVGDVNQRNEERKAKAASNSKQADKIGYVPRNKQAAGMNATGLSSAGMMGKSKGNDDGQALDEDSAAGLARLREKDAEIDAGVDAISRTIDNLVGIAGQMKDETLAQNEKLERIDGNMQKTTEKQTMVNAQQRYLLK
mmetsp:Transcript_611/g.1198  ORF Transcript_611/g.1198 Transcript_611/m.1198 type:complete len:353 (+) Transcript_611:114-1172(+)